MVLTFHFSLSTLWRNFLTLELKGCWLVNTRFEFVPPGLTVGFACIGGSRDFLHVKLQKFILGASRALFDFDGWIDLFKYFSKI